MFLNALTNGIIGFVGTLATIGANGQELKSGPVFGALLTGVLVALKDVHSFLQEPPK